MSDEPIRLRNDPSLGAAMRSGLDDLADREVGYDVDAGYARFVAAAAVATVATAGAATASAATGAATSAGVATTGLASTTVSLTTKVTLALLLTSASAAGVWRATRSPTPAPASTSTPVDVRPLPSPLAPGASGRAGGDTAISTAEVDLVPSARAQPPQVVSTGLGGTGAAEPRRGGAAPASVEEETRHLAELRALEGGDPAGALRAAEAGHARFPRGVFYQEREAIAILALRRLGRGPEADARAEAFVARFPRSPFVEALRGGAPAEAPPKK